MSAVLYQLFIWNLHHHHPNVQNDSSTTSNAIKDAPRLLLETFATFGREWAILILTWQVWHRSQTRSPNDHGHASRSAFLSLPVSALFCPSHRSLALIARECRNASDSWTSEDKRRRVHKYVARKMRDSYARGVMTSLYARSPSSLQHLIVTRERWQTSGESKGNVFISLVISCLAFSWLISQCFTHTIRRLFVYFGPNEAFVGICGKWMYTLHLSFPTISSSEENRNFVIQMFRKWNLETNFSNKL